MTRPHDILFRTLADPTRRAIFERLCRDGDQTVGALTAQAGVSQPAVSKHLGVLKQAGLARDRREGRQTHYSAQLGALVPLIDWTSQMAQKDGPRSNAATERLCVVAKRTSKKSAKAAKKQAGQLPGERM
jgi:DNA-binding transcriptional ArsR family regulator